MKFIVASLILATASAFTPNTAFKPRADVKLYGEYGASSTSF